MPVRTLLGEGPEELAPLLFSTLRPSQVLYVGVRDVDPPEQCYIDKHGMVLVPPSPPEALVERLRAACAGFDAAYVHVDLDVLEPSEFPHTCCPTAGGLSLPLLLEALAAVKTALPSVVGCGLTECCGDPSDHASTLAAVVDALAAMVETR